MSAAARYGTTPDGHIPLATSDLTAPESAAGAITMTIVEPVERPRQTGVLIAGLE
jgi:hypothetical protein